MARRQLSHVRFMHQASGWSDAVLPTVEALTADKSGLTKYYLMFKTYQCIKINPFAIIEIGLINLFVEKCQI